MQVKAVARNTGVSAKKLHNLVELVRGKPATEAVQVLRFQTSPHAKLLAKVVRSAIANAENNYQQTAADMKVAHVFIDQAASLKRFEPRARGRIGYITKRSSHVTVVLEGGEV
ncbi:MAG: 50S ribosomal protein L22 [Chloroflexi bacterium]|nr:50S ribosomal protein L22 [Chloroflexota bacterium]